MNGFPAKYGQMIDDETWRFIERTSSLYPVDSTDMSIEEQRSNYDAMCAEFHAGYPAGIQARDGLLDACEPSVPVRNYVKQGANPIAHVLYFHGGGYVLGGLDSHDDVCAEFCDTANCHVTSVDYRLAPEHRHPAAFDDCFAAYRFLAENTGLPIILAGDSAGGTLAASVAHAARGMPVKPVGQLLIYPALGRDMTLPSYREHEHAPMLSRADVVFYHDVRGETEGDDPTRYPLTDTDFSQLPPTIVISAQCDPLASEAEAYHNNLVGAGTRCVWFDEAGLVHGYLRARHTVDRARKSFSRMTEALVNLASGKWPYN